MGICFASHKNHRINPKLQSDSLTGMQIITKKFARIDLVMLRMSSESKFFGSLHSKPVLLSNPCLNLLYISHVNKRKLVQHKI